MLVEEFTLNTKDQGTVKITFEENRILSLLKAEIEGGRVMNECNKDAFRHKKRRLMKELAL